jgi:hypothetical protein
MLYIYYSKELRCSIKTIVIPKAASGEGNSMSKFVGGARIQKELQGFAAFVAYQECHYKGLSTSKDSIEHSMEQQFFGVKGDADFIGLSEQLVKGIGVFGGLYTLEGIATLDASTFANTPTRHDDSVLVLKPELHCLGHHVHVACGSKNGILLPLMLQVGLTNKEHITIRTLKFRAMEYLKNCKKALSIAMSPESPYKDYTKKGNLPSGMVHSDYLKYVREKMYEMLQKRAVAAEVSCVDADDATDPAIKDLAGTDAPAATIFVADAVPGTTNTNSISGNVSMPTMVLPTMPDTWFFPGYLVFAILGPIVADEDMLPYRAELLMPTTPSLPTDEKVKAGRNFQRTSSSALRRLGKAKNDDGIVVVKTEPGLVPALTLTETPSHGSSEVTLHHRLVAAGIAQSKVLAAQSKVIADRQHKSRFNDRKVAYRQNIIVGKEKLIEAKRFQIGRSGDPSMASQLAIYLNDLQVMLLDLSVAYDELHKLEFQLIEEQELQDVEGHGTTSFSDVATEAIDLTLACVFDTPVLTARNNKRLRMTTGTTSTTMGSDDLSSDEDDDGVVDEVEDNATICNI